VVDGARKAREPNKAGKKRKKREGQKFDKKPPNQGKNPSERTEKTQLRKSGPKMKCQQSNA